MASEVCRRSEPQPAVGQFNTESGPSKCRLLPLNVRGNAGPSGGTLGPPLGLALTGMRRDFPHSCNGVDAPRLVVFEVINLKHWKGEVRGTDYTRWSPRCCSSRRGRSGQARDPGSCRRRAGHVLTNRALTRDKFIAWCAQLPARLHRRHGDQLQCAPLGAQAHARWAWTHASSPRNSSAPIANKVPAARTTPTMLRQSAKPPARPQMHFVPVKTIEQQSMLCVHRLREGFKAERTACINRIRGLLAEFGLVFAQEPRRARRPCWPTCSKTRATR